MDFAGSCCAPVGVYRKSALELQKSSWALPASPHPSKRAETELPGFAFDSLGSPGAVSGYRQAPAAQALRLPGLAVCILRSGGHGGIAPKGCRPHCFGSLELALNPRPGFVHESRGRPHLPKSLFPILGRWTAPWKKPQVLCCQTRITVCV